MQKLRERFGAIGRASGRKRALLAGGTLLLVGAVATAAAFTDWANLNLGGEGIGNSNRFDIGVVLADDTVEQADSDAGYDWIIDGSDGLIPGGEISTSIPVFNNTRNMRAMVSFETQLLNGDGSVGSQPNITKFLRFSAAIDGTELFADLPWDQAGGELGTLAARGSDPLSQGGVYVAGAEGSEATLDLTIAYLDEPETVDYNGGQSALRLRFDAESVA